jgi:hypothetical protein
MYLVLWRRALRYYKAVVYETKGTKGHTRFRKEQDFAVTLQNIKHYIITT